jgi:hypothetical protein
VPDPQAIRHTSDVLLAQLKELEELERTKRELEPGSRAQLRLTRRVETLARKVLNTAGHQADLVEAIAEVADATIGKPMTREPHIILAEWREAERAVEAERSGSAAWKTARADVDRLRDEYRRAFDERGRRT